MDAVGVQAGLAACGLWRPPPVCKEGFPPSRGTPILESSPLTFCQWGLANGDMRLWLWVWLGSQLTGHRVLRCGWRGTLPPQPSTSLSVFKAILQCQNLLLSGVPRGFYVAAHVGQHAPTLSQV